MNRSLSTSMPPAHASAAAASRADETPLSGSSIRSKGLKRMARGGEDDGCALDDEVLLLFASFLATADLRHCAATCRRWRRLITGEAEFIFRAKQPLLSSHRLSSAAALAIGFFHQRRVYKTPSAPSPPLQFLPAPSSPCASSLDAVIGGDPLRNSRLVASRNGRLLLELRRRGGDGALNLAVCNAITGRVFTLPSLPKKDTPKRYACELLAAGDLGADANPLLRQGPAGFRVLLLYARADGSMACRSCSSDADAWWDWGPECEVSGANVVSGRKLGEMDAGVAVGGAVFWLSGNVVFGLRLDTLEGKLESPRGFGMHHFGVGHPCPPDSRLVVLDDGRLGAVQVGRGGGGGGAAGRFVMNIFSRNDDGRKQRWAWEEDARDVELESLLPASVVSGGVKGMRLRAVCERSGLIFLAVVHGRKQERTLYAMDLGRKKVQLMPVHPGGCCFSRPSACSFHGCDIDLVAYLLLGCRELISSSHAN